MLLYDYNIGHSNLMEAKMPKLEKQVQCVRV